jgi:DNA-binding LacI/PurR family transcriptional regulator
LLSLGVSPALRSDAEALSEAEAGTLSKPTILDVADRAGVSKSLVSLVMRESPNVSDEKRAAVLAAARDLGYRPNAVARSLVQQRSNLIGVMLSNIHNPFYADVVEGIEEHAGANGYGALFNSGKRLRSREARALETLLGLQTDGLILAGTLLDTKTINKAGRIVPIVLLARAARSKIVDSVAGNERVGPALAVDHLVSLGHRRIAHIDGGSGAGARSRRAGYRNAMERYGCEPTSVAGTFTEEGGAAGVRRLVAEGQHPTAILAGNDLAALGALQVLRELGLVVPDDVSLVGYDNAWLAGLQHLSLTTVDQPRHEFGVTAVELLVERLDRGRTEARHVVLNPTLVVRSTTGPVGRGL